MTVSEEIAALRQVEAVYERQMSELDRVQRAVMLVNPRYVVLRQMPGETWWLARTGKLGHCAASSAGAPLRIRGRDRRLDGAGAGVDCGALAAMIYPYERAKAAVGRLVDLRMRRMREDPRYWDVSPAAWGAIEQRAVRPYIVVKYMCRLYDRDIAVRFAPEV